ncbi:MAG: PHP-associated domain-containing protein [Bacteroidota bacterium]
MNRYRADLHIHTVLSPCGDLSMSPHNILEHAARKSIDIIGIADHNSTLQSQIIADLSGSYGITVLCGAEVTSMEEAHCLCFFPENKLTEFQSYLDKHLIKYPNDPDKLGYQVVVDAEEQILQQLDYSLFTSLDQSVDQISKKVHELDGIFIPAHINKSRFSLLSQLGFIPDDLNEDALEISFHTTKEKVINEYPILQDKTFIQSSDAHYPEDIGKIHTLFKMNSRSFDEIKQALHNKNGRNIYI